MKSSFYTQPKWIVMDQQVLHTMAQRNVFTLILPTNWCWELVVIALSKFLLFVCYGYLKDIYCTFWMSKRCLLYITNVSKMSFVHYEWIKDVIGCYGCLKDVFLYVMNVLETSFLTFWISKICLLYVIRIRDLNPNFWHYIDQNCQNTPIWGFDFPWKVSVL